MKCSACKDRPKFWKGSDPKCAFAGGHEWSSDNWNCATTGLIRRLFDGALLEGVSHQWDNDQNTGMVCAQGLASEDRPLSLWLTWYKNRGRTEQMWLMFDNKQPRRPTEAELVALAAIYRSNLSHIQLPMHEKMRATRGENDDQI